MQIPIQAGHEFWVTTEKEYAEAGTAEYMYVDYVSCLVLGAVLRADGPGQYRQGHLAWQADLRRRRYVHCRSVRCDVTNNNRNSVPPGRLD